MFKSEPEYQFPYYSRYSQITLVSGHRCRCNVDEKHHFKVHTEHQVCIADRSSHTLTRRPLSSLSIFQLNEFSFVIKLSTMMVCRQLILTSTTLELSSIALNCRIITNLCTLVQWNRLKRLTFYSLISTVLWLAGDVDTQRRVQ